MRNRFVSGFLAAVFMLVLPVWFSPSSGDDLMRSAPFPTVAMAGHITSSGFYCDCTNGQCGVQNITLADRSGSNQNDAKEDADALPDYDLGAMMVLALLVYLGMRA